MREATSEASARRVTRREAVMDVVAVIVLVPAAAIGSGLLLGLVSSEPRLAEVVLVQALLVLAGVYTLMARRERRFAEIGLVRPRANDIGRALLVVLAAFGVNIVLTLAVLASSPETLEQHLAGLESIALGLSEGAPFAATLVLLLLVGFYEELVARGLLLTRLREILGGFWPPAIVSAVLFALGHFYQGVYGMVQTALLGLVLAAFTLRWGTLWPAILAHSAVNILSVVQLREIGIPDL